MKSHRFKNLRGMNRKTLRQVPASHITTTTKTAKTNRSLSDFINQLSISNKVVDVAKKAPSGVWRISNGQVQDIARKYKFFIPNEEKPMKHLGSTGIQLIMFRPGVYYLYKPRGARKHKHKKPGGMLAKFNWGAAS